MSKSVITFNDVTFKYYSQSEPTLHGINLTINQGEKILILGPSGSGKSTLAHCLNGLIPFSYKGDLAGELTINGKATQELDLFQISRMVGTVLQDTDGQFIGLSVGEDLAFSLENERIEQEQMKQIVQKTAALVGVESYLDYSIHELSGGLKQRVSLGGVMVDEEVNILLFDEPLANLDPATGHYAMSLIDRIHQTENKTIIMIEHRLEDALQLQFDRIIVMDEGRIVSDTTPNELLSSGMLDTVNIREPLYTKAMKYSGITVTPEKKPEHIDSVVVTDEDRVQLQRWVSEAEQEPKPPLTEPLLRIKDVSFSYASKKTISDVSFEIHKGEMISLVGRNGAGKSTLAKLISGFERISEGSIEFEGEALEDKTIFQRAEKIGYVLQNPNHMISKHLVTEEVGFGLQLRNVPEAEIAERVEQTLRVCGLYPFRNWPISALSFGQKKRVTIASILVLNPSLLILDEPTAGQDLRHFTEIMDFLRELNEAGISILFITHDMHLMLEYTTRALVLTDGKLLADRPPAEVLTDDTLIKQANLKRTSLFDLAVKADIKQPHAFIDHFISYDRKVRKTWR